MCTSISLKTKDQHHFLARTMDFTRELDVSVVYSPRGYEWFSDTDKEYVHTADYGFVGAGREIDNKYFFADGVNEHGLSVAELYYPREAKYHKESKAGKINLGPHELIMWILGNMKTLDELKAQIDKVRLVELHLSLLDETPPLHYIVGDRSGKTVVLESESGELVWKENPVGVMTNAPDFDWHLKNLNNYLYLKNSNLPNRKFVDAEAHPFGQAAGTFGLPGGYTPPERFVRTVFMKDSVPEANTLIEGLSTVHHILSVLNIPKGINVTPQGNSDYTQYTAIMSLDEPAYYIHTYTNPEVRRVKLDEKILSEKEIVEFKLDQPFYIKDLND